MPIPIPEGYVGRLTGVQLGWNSKGKAPFDVIFGRQASRREEPVSLMYEDEDLFVEFYGNTYGDRLAYWAITPREAIRVAQTIQNNAAVIQRIFRPAGIRLIPTVAGADPIMVPEGARMSLVGDMIMIENHAGEQISQVPAAEFSLEWLRGSPTTP